MSNRIFVFMYERVCFLAIYFRLHCLLKEICKLPSEGTDAVTTLDKEVAIATQKCIQMYF